MAVFEACPRTLAKLMLRLYLGSEIWGLAFLDEEKSQGWGSWLE
jgi:hypothetical protein